MRARLALMAIVILATACGHNASVVPQTLSGGLARDASPLGLSSKNFIAFYPETQANTDPTSIITGPDGNLWALDGHNEVEKITPSGAITVFPFGDAFQGPLAVGSGSTLWSEYYQADGICKT